MRCYLGWHTWRYGVVVGAYDVLHIVRVCARCEGRQSWLIGSLGWSPLLKANDTIALEIKRARGLVNAREVKTGADV